MRVKWPLLVRAVLLLIVVLRCGACDQVLKQRRNARLLLCAPGNFSADLLADALAKAGLSGQQMLRMNDPRRPPPQVWRSSAHVWPESHLDITISAQGVLAR